MKCHPVVTDINFPALLICIATNYCISNIHCTNQKLILLLSVRMVIPLWSVSPAQMKSGLYFLITNKLNVRRWVKTPSVKMVGTIICHQSVSIKLSFWLSWGKRKKRNPPPPKKKSPRKKEVKPSNTSHIQDKGGTEFCREMLHWRLYAYREDGHWAVWAVSMHRMGEQIQSERKTQNPTVKASGRQGLLRKWCSPEWKQRSFLVLNVGWKGWLGTLSEKVIFCSSLLCISM